ncbi:hypothetical protein AVEN_57835-1 [Araneus ventricosus]|uniref:Uncharacterized protein n=1 Tax=Araneus ventricosus TaxID=182803 RepID=A0A4Y2I969_ARAVE|nr:hypothetical protein AVEN_57835-1 [Araneus ventricosus]
MMTHRKWETFLVMNIRNMLSSHEMYLRYVMVISGFVAHFTDNIFDKLLSAFALVINFNIETLRSTGVNFCELTNDIFMVIYNSVLKELFSKHGGMERLAEYVNLHEYLTWKWQWKDIISPYDPDIFVVHIQKDLDNKIHEELAKEPYFPEFISHDHVLSHFPSLLLALKILSFLEINFRRCQVQII